MDLGNDDEHRVEILVRALSFREDLGDEKAKKKCRLHFQLDMTAMQLLQNNHQTTICCNRNSNQLPTS